MPIRQKVRPLLLLRKQLGHFQRVGTNTLAIGNRLQGVGTGPGQTGLRALSLAATVGSDDVTVNFNEGVVVADPTSGVSITVNGQAATFTAAKSGTSMVYTLTSQNPIDYEDVIVWAYDSTAAGADPYVGEDSSEELADSQLTRVMPAAPPSTVLAIAGWTGAKNCETGDPALVFEAPLTAGLALTTGGATPTFSRASIATVVTSDGLVTTVAANEARFAGSTRNGENNWAEHPNSKGILIEEQRTNLVTHSHEFDNAAWGKANTTVDPNSAVSPDGTSNADLVYPASTGTNRNVELVAPAAVGNVDVVQSAYIKASGFRWVYFNLYDGANIYNWYDLQNGVLGTTDPSVTASIEDVGNGWYRCIARKAFTNGQQYCSIRLADADNSTTATANSTDGILVWGAQVEEAAFVSSYIPTSGGIVTRAADSLTYDYQPPALVGSMVADLQQVGPNTGTVIGNNVNCQHIAHDGNKRITNDGTNTADYEAADDAAAAGFGVTWNDGGVPEVATYKAGSQVNTGALDADGYAPGTDPLVLAGNTTIKSLKFYNEAKDQTFMENETS